jgi:LexA-binding, inner membrane-associated putative hydrolase
MWQFLPTLITSHLMPSPLGHAVAGLAAGWLIAGAPAPFKSPASTAPAAPASNQPWISTWRAAFVFAALAVSPDLDLLVHAHSMYTHSIGAALIVTLAVAALTPAQARRWTAAFACGAAYATHILLDWMGNDTTPPIGIMALWPFTSYYYESDLHFFMAITRRYWLPGFWSHNLIAMLREIGTLVPLALVIYFLRRRRATVAPA